MASERGPGISDFFARFPDEAACLCAYCCGQMGRPLALSELRRARNVGARSGIEKNGCTAVAVISPRLRTLSFIGPTCP